MVNPPVVSIEVIISSVILLAISLPFTVSAAMMLVVLMTDRKATNGYMQPSHRRVLMYSIIGLVAVPLFFDCVIFADISGYNWTSTSMTFVVWTTVTFAAAQLLILIKAIHLSLTLRKEGTA